MREKTMRTKLMFVGTVAIIILLARADGLLVRQLVRSTWSIARSQTPDAETFGEANVADVAKGMVETGALDLVENAWVFTIQGKKKRLTVNSLTAVYVQGETLYRTPQGEAALEACAQERCSVYVVWSSQPGLASAIVVALSPARQVQFPDPDPAGKTPIPFPSPTPPWIRIPPIVPATPLIK
jgi:hypothetical protein